MGYFCTWTGDPLELPEGPLIEWFGTFRVQSARTFGCCLSGLVLRFLFWILLLYFAILQCYTKVQTQNTLCFELVDLLCLLLLNSESWKVAVLDMSTRCYEWTNDIPPFGEYIDDYNIANKKSHWKTWNESVLSTFTLNSVQFFNFPPVVPPSPGNQWAI